MKCKRPGKWDFDPDDDFLVADGLEEVAVHSQNADGTFENPYYAQAVRESVNRNKVSGITAIDLVWHINAADVPGEIRPGDLIVSEDDSKWVVNLADLAGASDQWRCETTRGHGEFQP
jgi:hypothetical protein